MKLLSIQNGHAIRFLNAEQGTPQLVYGMNVSKAFEKKYGFVEGPRTVKDFDLANGMTFLHGIFDGKVVIDKVKVYSNGIIAEAKADTVECVAFIMDVIEWAKNEIGLIMVPNTESPELYTSTLEVQMDCDLAKPFSYFDQIGKMVETMLGSYRMPARTYEVSGFQFGDRDSQNTPFKFERRTGHAFSENVYFSIAPLKTQDHLRLLETLESLIGS
jgi:hypothetical protein